MDTEWYLLMISLKVPSIVNYVQIWKYVHDIQILAKKCIKKCIGLEWVKKGKATTSLKIPWATIRIETVPNLFRLLFTGQCLHNTKTHHPPMGEGVIKTYQWGFLKQVPDCTIWIQFFTKFSTQEGVHPLPHPPPVQLLAECRKTFTMSGKIVLINGYFFLTHISMCKTSDLIIHHY